MNTKLKPAVSNMRKAGRTIKWWAESNGFEYQTVVKVVNGFVGKRRIGVTLDIINALKRDGYLTDEDIVA